MNFFWSCWIYACCKFKYALDWDYNKDKRLTPFIFFLSFFVCLLDIFWFIYLFTLCSLLFVLFSPFLNFRPSPLFYQFMKKNENNSAPCTLHSPLYIFSPFSPETMGNVQKIFQKSNTHEHFCWRMLVGTRGTYLLLSLPLGSYLWLRDCWVSRVHWRSLWSSFAPGDLQRHYKTAYTVWLMIRKVVNVWVIADNWFYVSGCCPHNHSQSIQFVTCV